MKTRESDRRAADSRGGRCDLLKKPSPPDVASDPLIRLRMVRLAYRYLWNREEAEDVAQEALSVAIERLDLLRDRKKWWAWVCRIMVNTCHARHRGATRRQAHSERYARHRAIGMAEPQSPAAGERTEMLRAALGKLPRRQQDVVVLRHLQGMSFDEIGRILEISPATARVHAMAGRESLRKLMLESHAELF
ncbi:MAG: RNA polymerase sigma factor [Phycisphaerae bacterium]